MHFGGHGKEHFRFSRISPEEQGKEIKAAAQFLKRFCPAPWAFSYPYGAYNDTSFELLENNGFIAAFATEEKEKHDNAYAIGRVDTVSIK